MGKQSNEITGAKQQCKSLISTFFSKDIVKFYRFKNEKRKHKLFNNYNNIKGKLELNSIDGRKKHTNAQENLGKRERQKADGTGGTRTGIKGTVFQAQLCH